SFAFVALLIPVFGRAVRDRGATSRSVLDAIASRVAGAPRGAVLAYLYVQFVLVATYTALGGTFEPWFFAYPAILVAFRYVTVDAVFLYGSVLLTILVELLLLAFRRGTPFK